jgi:predicted RNA-binding Zn-ribbon protein involved in translation (DUF1610 family)
MTTTPNDPHHDIVRDIHYTHPTTCRACSFNDNTRTACLEHTCPDCGAITYGLTNDAGELTHDCCAYCVKYANRMMPPHFGTRTAPAIPVSD